MNNYYSPILSDTQADVFAVVGLARLLHTSDGSPMINHDGDYYVVQTNDDLSSADVQEARAKKQLYKFLDDGKCGDSNGLAAYDYVDRARVENEKREKYRKVQEELQKQPAMRKNPDVQQRIAEYAPDPEHRLHTVFKTMQTHKAANNSLRKALTSKNRQEVISSLTALKVRGGPLPTIKVDATANQLINPLLAKGCRRPKPDNTKRDIQRLHEVRDSEFLQYLRYGGYYATAVPHTFKEGDKYHLRLLTPAPHRISLANLIGLVTKLRASGARGKRCQRDVLAAVETARLLIDHSEFGTAVLPDLLSILNKTPADIISGLYATHYMPTSQHVKNIVEMSFMPLPSWFAIRSADEAQAWREILSEHRSVLLGLKERNSAELGLLKQYRLALQRQERDALENLIEFIGRYGSYCMSATNDRGRSFMARFTTANIERMAQHMAADLSAILADPGFRAVARAIRKATVNAQVQKALHAQDPSTPKPWREIRYGLLAELNRKRVVRDEFVESLAEFLASYNRENARRRETEKRTEAAPGNVTTEEFEALTRLIDGKGSMLVGSLLCAYGTCREPKGVDESQEEPFSEDVAELEDTEEEDD
ncbi:MAG: hypothetical protein Q7T82_20985 [Armatimonadota bacterium]|nr:hypothetical protein [Armatimonadota bacterium]